MDSMVKTRELFPPPVINLWNQWQLRHLVLLSFMLQAILAVLGSRRKTTTSTIMRIVVWLSYLFADAVAGLALGIFSQKDPEEKSLVLVLWIPLLLLHLGGPDFITAYALEDNELWLRHLLGLVIQVVGAFYVFFKSWDTDSPITFLAIPLFVAGLIKYGERTWALKSATSEKFIEVARSNVGVSKRELEVGTGLAATDEGSSSFSTATGKMNLICTAYNLLNVSGTVLTDEKNDKLAWKCTYLIKHAPIKCVYSMIEIQLGLLYNWFYTKAQVFYSPIGFILRLISFCCVIAVTVAFTITHSMRDYDTVDVVFSYILLTGAILLEIYSVTLLLLSDWLVILLYVTKRGQGRVKTAEAICKLKLSTDGSKWSGAIGRFSMLNYVFGKSPTMCYIPENWDKHFYKTRETLPPTLKEIVYRELVDDRRGYVAKWSKGIEEKYGNDHLRWIFDFSFSSSILIWHVATEILYLLDSDESDPYRKLNGLKVVPNRKKSLEISNSSRELSRQISEYMMYLLVLCPSMIPGGVQEYKVRDATSWIRSEFGSSSSEDTRREAYARILFKTFHYGIRRDSSDSEEHAGHGYSEEQKGNVSEDHQESNESLSDAFDSKEQTDHGDLEDQKDKVSEDQYPESNQIAKIQNQTNPKSKRLPELKHKVLKFLSMKNQGKKGTGDAPKPEIKIPEKGEMHEACRLADMFLSSSGGRNWTEQRRWKMIREVWLEMLFYAAYQCRWEAHVQHLRRGGEFITHVWMLMLLLGGTN